MMRQPRLCGWRGQEETEYILFCKWSIQFAISIERPSSSSATLCLVGVPPILLLRNETPTTNILRTYGMDGNVSTHTRWVYFLLSRAYCHLMVVQHVNVYRNVCLRVCGAATGAEATYQHQLITNHRGQRCTEMNNRRTICNRDMWGMFPLVWKNCSHCDCYHCQIEILT